MSAQADYLNLLDRNDSDAIAQRNALLEQNAFYATERMAKDGMLSDTFENVLNEARQKNLIPPYMSAEAASQLIYNLFWYKQVSADKKARFAIEKAHKEISKLPEAYQFSFETLAAPLLERQEKESKFSTVALPEQAGALIEANAEPADRTFLVNVSPSNYPAVAGGIIGILSNEEGQFEVTQDCIRIRYPEKGFKSCNFLMNEAIKLIADSELMHNEIFDVEFDRKVA